MHKTAVMPIPGLSPEQACFSEGPKDSLGESFGQHLTYCLLKYSEPSLE